MKNRPAAAFTLIELLAVVAVIGLLAALIFAAVQKIHRQGLMTQSAHHLRVLATANMDFLGEHGRYAPADEKRNLRRWHGARKSVEEPFDPADGFLAPYLGKSRSITPCPLFREMLSGADSFEDGSGGYGYNASYIGGTPEGKWRSDGTRESARAGSLQRPAQTVMFTSTAYAREGGLQEYPFCEPPFWDYGNGPTENRPAPSVHFRFDGRALVAWCDGHITFEQPVERAAGFNPHGGDAAAHDLGWFGPEENNGYWNPQYEPER